MSKLDIHKEAQQLTEKVIILPTDYKDFTPSSKSDQVLIKQNNIIITLLLEIDSKLTKLVKGKEVEKSVSGKEIEDLISQLNKVEITPQKERIIKKQKKWTFFQLDQETQKDQDQVTQKIE